MTFIQSIILGIVQGIGEFLPISSSAHLIIIPYLLNFNITLSQDAKLAFDVALHFGTLISVIFVFWKDWLKIFMCVSDRIFKKKQSHENKIFWYLVIASIPGAIAGVFLEDIIKGVFREELIIIACFLAGMGVLIYVGDKWSEKYYKKHVTEFNDITLKQSILVGISQAFAIMPGFSRSGTTILMGRLIGMSREAITKFTFLLSTPIIFGATIVNLKDLVFTNEVIIGIITSAIIGILAIKFLLNYIKKHDFAIFAYYRLLIAIAIIIKLII